MATTRSKKGVTISNDNNTQIIVDDLFSFCLTEAITFLYIDCVFKVAAKRRLSFSLPKSSFSPTRITFVGVDVGKHHNFPDKNKHELLKTWSAPVDVRAVSSFIAFGIFFMKWTYFYEVK